MKMNMKFYKESEDYLSDNESKIISLMSENKSFDEIIEKEPTVNNYVYLSSVKENLLNWYDFKDNSSVLEIGAGFGELTNLLVKKVSNLVVIEENLKKAKILEERFKNGYDNLELIVGKFENINLKNKFDYIVITDYLEKNDFYKTLEIAKKYLKENGTFLVAVNNKYGIKNWKGKDDYKNLLNQDKSTKKYIENSLNKLGFRNYKFYYIYPEYKAPNLIYTDEYKLTIEDTSRNFELNEVFEETNFKENELLENLLKDESELINFFANSFLIEISNSKLNNVKYVAFTNYRKVDKQIQTIISTDKVIKKPVTKEAEKHIKEMILNQQYFPKGECLLLDKKKDDITVESDFINGKRLDEIIEASPNVKEEFDKYKKLLFNSNKIISYEKINKEELIEPLKDLKEDILKDLNFTEFGFIDMVPKNCFVVGGMKFFFDQEWLLKFVPLEYILYRAIKNTYSIDREELYKQYGLYKNIELFEKIEEYFRKMIIDETVLVQILARPAILKKQRMKLLKDEIDAKEVMIQNLQAQNNELTNIKLKLEQANQELELFKQELETHNKELQSIIEDRDNQLTIIANSLSWKITKPIRWISAKIREVMNKFKKGEKN